MTDTGIKKDSDLSPDAYHVLREKGTEAPFSGKYVDMKEKGMYRCVACGASLFSSDTKFDSGTGWPSFTDPAALSAVKLIPDDSLWRHRTEVVCAKCGGHLGHVFDDGPTGMMPSGKEATGKRYCINSVCLEFEKETESK